MTGIIIILICNVMLYGVVRWFMDSDLVKEHGEHQFSYVLILGIVVFWFFMGSVGTAIFVEQATTGAARFTYGSVAILTALPWALPFILVFTDGASSSVVDGLYGTRREGIAEADLKQANEVATSLLKSVANRLKSTDHGKLARERLNDIRARQSI